MKNPYYAQPGTRGVYAIVDPRNRETVYVGSSENIEARFVQHRSGGTSSGKKAERKAWATELRASGLEPELRVLEVVASGAMRSVEGWWIALYRDAGQARFNTHVAVGQKQDLEEQAAALRARVAELEAMLGERAKP